MSTHPYHLQVGHARTAGQTVNCATDKQCKAKAEGIVDGLRAGFMRTNRAGLEVIDLLKKDIDGVVFGPDRWVIHREIPGIDGLYLHFEFWKT